MSKLKPIPQFKNEDAEREFWATRDTTEYFDTSKPIKLIFPNLKPSTETISGAYIVRMTSKFLPCLQSATNLLATVRRLMVDSNGLNVFTCEGVAAQGAAQPRPWTGCRSLR